MFWMELPGARLPSRTMSITCTTVAPTPTIVTAITVASRKPSLRTAEMNPRTPRARFAKPISCWNGLPFGQSIDSATMSGVKT